MTDEGETYQAIQVETISVLEVSTRFQLKFSKNDSCIALCFIPGSNLTTIWEQGKFDVQGRPGRGFLGQDMLC